MVPQFTPVQPGWKVLYEQPGKSKVWLPLLGWFQAPDGTVQPAVWFGGVVTAEAASELLALDEWSVMESDYPA